jgi:hypothetical protein
MFTLNSQQEKNLTAFIKALSQQDEPLPEGLQRQLHAIGQNLDARADEVLAIAASLPRLNQAYQDALAEVQEPEKGATLVSISQDDSARFQERTAQILTDPDPVQAARRSQSRGIGQIASNPMKRLFGGFRNG